MGIRLNKALTILNISLKTAVEFLKSQSGLEPIKEMNVNTKISDSQYNALEKRFAGDKAVKDSSKTIFFRKKKAKFKPSITNQNAEEFHNDGLRIQNLTDSNLEKTDFPERINAPIGRMTFENGNISFVLNNNTYVCFDERISKALNSHKKLSPIKDELASIIINHHTHYFTFSDSSVIDNLAKLSMELENERERQKAEQKEKKEKQRQQKLQQQQLMEEQKNTPIFREVNIQFFQLKFDDDFVEIRIKKVPYWLHDKRIKGYNRIINRYIANATKSQRKGFRHLNIKIILNEEEHSFRFKDFNLFKYMNDIKEQSLSQKNGNQKVSSETKITEIVPNLERKKRKLSIDNIEFYDGYYMIYLISNGVKDSRVVPLKISNAYSYACLRVALQHLKNNFPSGIVMEYNDKRIIGITPEYNLSKYIRVLNEEYFGHIEWIAEYENEVKPSLNKCRSISQHIAKKKISMKCYLDNLANLQKEQKLCLVYEVNHGKPQDAFIFTIEMPDNRQAIVFENAEDESSTATEIFITKKENEERCINLVFDYFTNYAIENKRDDLRLKKYPPTSFMAEEFHRIGHSELETWLLKLNEILKKKTEKSYIEFVPGLHVPQDYESRSGHDTISIKNIHNELIRRLYEKLCTDFGAENVGTEIRVGNKRIDTVVRTSDGFDIYEIKTDIDPAVCVTHAMGQICEYAYLYCRDNIGKMVVVGPGVINQEVSNQLSWLRKKYSLGLYYMNI